jgi:hypothetical protein
MAPEREPEIRVRSNDVYIVGRPLTTHEQQINAEGAAAAQPSTAPRYHERETPPQVLKDAELESSERRAGFDEKEGLLSFQVEPGDELGELTISIQFEGTKGAHASGVKHQLKHLEQATDWLRELLGELEAPWDVDLVSVPCAKTEEPFDVRRVQARLELQAEQQLAAERGVHGGVDLRRERDRKHDR